MITLLHLLVIYYLTFLFFCYLLGGFEYKRSVIPLSVTASTSAALLFYTKCDNGESGCVIVISIALLYVTSSILTLCACILNIQEENSKRTQEKINKLLHV